MPILKLKTKTQKILNTVDFLFEAATLKRLKRTGWQILGDNNESVAEHSFVVCVISYVLGIQLKANLEKLIVMALFHDFTESRTGDIYKLADLYIKADVTLAAKDAFANLQSGAEMVKILREYEKRQTQEARIVHDADTLALCLELKQLMEKGSLQAKEWFYANKKAIKLKQSEDLFEDIEKTDSQNWWKKERGKIFKRF